MLFAFPASLSRIGRWPRLLAAAACLLLALVSALDSTRGRAAVPAPSAEREVPVVVAAGTLAAGHLLRARDLVIAQWPDRLRPPGAAAQVADRVGERLAGPLAAGEAVTRTRLVGSSLTAGLNPGLAAVSLTLADARAAELVRPGDRVDLLSTPRDDLSLDVGAGGSNSASGSAALVASHVLVLAVLAATPDESLSGESTALVVAVSHTDTLRLARAQNVGVFTAVVVSP